MKRKGLSATQRTMRHLKGQGHTAKIVEVFVKPAGMAFGVKRDCCGLADIISFKPIIRRVMSPATGEIRDVESSQMFWVQCCAVGGISSHKHKAEASEYLKPLLQSGTRFVIVAWHGWEAEPDRRDEFKCLEAKLANNGIAWVASEV